MSIRNAQLILIFVKKFFWISMYSHNLNLKIKIAITCLHINLNSSFTNETLSKIIYQQGERGLKNRQELYEGFTLHGKMSALK